LTGTALAARFGEKGRRNDDGGMMDHKKGRVRGRMQRLAKTAPSLVLDIDEMTNDEWQGRVMGNW